MRRLRRGILACFIDVAGVSGGARAQSSRVPDATAHAPGTALLPKPEARGQRALQGGGKTHRRGMTSCAEASFFLQTCGLTRLDADRDGVPCAISHGPHTR